MAQRVRVIRVVAPFTGAWIEIQNSEKIISRSRVAPFTGAWIEITRPPVSGISTRVAPFTGAWIEIAATERKNALGDVAPFTGAWIEILLSVHGEGYELSRPSRARGLKSSHPHRACFALPRSRPSRARGLKFVIDRTV